MAESSWLVHDDTHESSSVSDIEFRKRIEPLLSKRGLGKSDLQVNLKVEEMKTLVSFVDRDWYSFGKSMSVDIATLDYIKENSKTKQDKKIALLEYLIGEKKVRYEGIIYGHYKQDPNSSFISSILDYLTDQRHNEEPQHRPREPKPRRQYSQKVTPPKEASYEYRKSVTLPTDIAKCHLNAANYKEQFFNKLCFEEKEHMQKLKQKCNGRYYLYIISDDEVPPEVKEDDIKPQKYGFIESNGQFTDDKIEYATQTSECVFIYDANGSNVCKAFIPSYNHVHLEERLYVCLPYGIKQKLNGKPRNTDGGYVVDVEFEVKHSYFNNLHHSVVNLPSYVKSSLMPTSESFSELEMKFKPQWSEYNIMSLDSDKQRSALKMITSTSSHSDITACPPPVILYGPFGSGKTRILARAAYEIISNGVAKGIPTRILICAHHPQSTNAFIDNYFLHIEQITKKKFPFKVLHVSRYLGNPYTTSQNRHFYTTIDDLEHIEMKHDESVIIIASYTSSLRLYNIFNVPDYGFFTHLFLDEAAQVREPEAITPLAMATRDAKIVLAGDDKQVGPRTLVLGDEARSSGLDISLLERLMVHYSQMGPIAQSYMTNLTMNYRSHESLLALPRLFYGGQLTTSTSKSFWHHVGPAGYRFVCSDSRLVPDYIDKEQPLVEACIVLEQVLKYLKEIDKEEEKTRKAKIKICIISSTRKQLNHLKKMSSRYPCYHVLKEKNVRFLPSFMIQGHEFQAIFLSLLEPLKTGDIKNYFTKSLFNPYVFNTVITRAKSLVVAVGKPQELLNFEDTNMSGSGGEIKCWHRYLRLCEEQKSISNLDQIEIRSNVLATLGIERSFPESELPYLIEQGATVTMSSSSSDDESRHTKAVYTDAQRVIKVPKSDAASSGPLILGDESSTILADNLQKTESRIVEIIEKGDDEKQKKEHTELEDLRKLKKEKDDWEKKAKRLETEIEDLQKNNCALKEEVAIHKKKAKAAIRDLSRQSSRLSNKSASDSSPMIVEGPNPFFFAEDDDDDSSVFDGRDNSAKTRPQKRNKKKTKSDSELLPKYQQSVCTQTNDTSIEEQSPTAVPKEIVSSPFLIAAIHVLFLLFVILSSLNLYQTQTITPLPGVEVLATKRLTVIGGQASTLHWDQFGLRLDIPSDALPLRSIAEVVVRVSVSGPYIYSQSNNNTWKLASAIYWITSSKDFQRPILLGLWHNTGGIANSSIIKVMTAQDIPQNRSYLFEHVSEFSINGSYVYLLLNHFSGYCALSTEDNFQGTLLYRSSPKRKDVWEYSFLIYKCFTSGINSRLLSISNYDGWQYELPNLDVVLENGSDSLVLNLQSRLVPGNWSIGGKIKPLKYKKSQLQEIEGSIRSNMVFYLQWKGKGFPTSAESEELTLLLEGAEQPTDITFFSNSVDEEGGNVVKGSTGGIIPRNENLLCHTEQISSPLTFCVNLGISTSECDKIKKDTNNHVDEQKIAAIDRWQRQKEWTWKDFITVLVKMDDCRTAKKLTATYSVYFYDIQDSDVLNKCPFINNIE